VWALRITPTTPKKAIAEKPGGSGFPQEDTSPTDPPNEFADLLTFARDKPLIGKELAVIEALCRSKGTLPIADLAIKKGVNWEDPKQGFKDVQRRLKPKLKRLGWDLVRQSNAANLIRLKKGKRS
jgi:hypothetical protein